MTTDAIVSPSSPSFASSTGAQSGPATYRGLRLFSKVLCCCVAFLIFAGARVTSNNAGLSVPDWPTSYGENMFLFPPSKWVGPIYYEHVHRLIASGIGALTLILTVWIWVADRRKAVRFLALAALCAVVLQGVLGGLTVLYYLPAWLSSAHGVLGQTFFAISIAIAYCYSAAFERRLADEETPQVLRGACIFIGLLYAQLILGAFMRHTESGLAIMDFPTAAGQWIPRWDANFFAVLDQMRQAHHFPSVEPLQVALHFGHRVLGSVIALFFAIGSIVLLGRPMSRAQRRILGAIIAVVMVQFFLGASVVLSVRHPEITSLHVLGGALLLALSVLLALRSAPHWLHRFVSR